MTTASNPIVEVTLVEGPVTTLVPQRLTSSGACLVFEGIVRPVEAGRALAALVYEDYEPMTSRELTRLAARIAEQHALALVRVHHSRGRVPAGQVSFRLEIASSHRKAAIRAIDEFIDTMKREIPLWKQPEWTS